MNTERTSKNIFMYIWNNSLEVCSGNKYITAPPQYVPFQVKFLERISSVRKKVLLSKLIFSQQRSYNTFPGLDENKLVQVWKNACHFYKSYFRRVMNSTLERTFLGVC